MLFILSVVVNIVLFKLKEEQMKRLFFLITIIIIVFTLNVISQKTEELTLKEFEGTLKKIGNEWFLSTDKDFYKLVLAPEDFLEENEIIMKPEEKFTLEGILEEGELFVYTIFIKENVIPLRDNRGNPIWEKTTKKDYYIVNSKKCIGCKLCVKYCPVDAITMVNGIALIDKDKCIDCGICVDGNGKKFKGCPVNAISRVE